eukprot:3871709-Pleurochrysis_carterae.AAC.1
MVRLIKNTNAKRVFFDKCTFGAPTPKATQLFASAKLLEQLATRFAVKFFNHPPGTHNSIVGIAASGDAYKTRAAQSYPKDMTAALADSILTLTSTTAAAPCDAGG